jgi:hypothetical protein
MPRTARERFAGARYHDASRGNERLPLFYRLLGDEGARHSVDRYRRNDSAPGPFIRKDAQL